MDRWTCEMCGQLWPNIDPSQAYYQRQVARESHGDKQCKPAPLSRGVLTASQAADLKKLLYK